MVLHFPVRANKRDLKGQSQLKRATGFPGDRIRQYTVSRRIRFPRVPTALYTTLTIRSWWSTDVPPYSTVQSSPVQHPFDAQTTTLVIMSIEHVHVLYQCIYTLLTNSDYTDDHVMSIHAPTLL